MADDGPPRSRRRVLGGLAAGFVAAFAGCGAFDPPDESTPTSTATPTDTPTATPTPGDATATTRPAIVPGKAVAVREITFAVREADQNDRDGYVDAEITIQNTSNRPLSRVGLVVDVLYEDATVGPTVVVTDSVGRHWPDGLAVGAEATLSPDHLYFVQSGDPWYQLEDHYYTLNVTVRVAEPVESS